MSLQINCTARHVHIHTWLIMGNERVHPSHQFVLIKLHRDATRATKSVGSLLLVRLAPQNEQGISGSLLLLLLFSAKCEMRTHKGSLLYHADFGNVSGSGPRQRSRRFCNVHCVAAARPHCGRIPGTWSSCCISAIYYRLVTFDLAQCHRLNVYLTNRVQPTFILFKPNILLHFNN